jgi:hypothetical protein
MHKLANDVSVDLREDRPGTLAQAIDAIAKSGINLDGYAEIEGILHVLTKDAASTRRALEAGGCQVRGEQPVVVVGVKDRPGVAAGILRRIADSGVNVNFSYLATNNRMVIAAADLQKVVELISQQAKPKPTRSGRTRKKRH